MKSLAGLRTCGRKMTTKGSGEMIANHLLFLLWKKKERENGGALHIIH